MVSSFGHETAETDRLIALSDGVIAIAITLLVLDLPVPTIPPDGPSSLLQARILERWHEFFAFALSFLVVGLYWMLHRRVHVHIDAHDRGVIWLNLFFLLAVASVPYATRLLTTYPDRFGVTVYAGVLAATGLSLTALWLYASRNELVDAGLSSRVVQLQAVRFAAAPLVFVLSMFVATVDPGLAMLTWLLLIPVNATLQSRTVERVALASDDAATQ